MNEGIHQSRQSTSVSSHHLAGIMMGADRLGMPLGSQGLGLELEFENSTKRYWWISRLPSSGWNRTQRHLSGSLSRRSVLRVFPSPAHKVDMDIDFTFTMTWRGSISIDKWVLMILGLSNSSTLFRESALPNLQFVFLCFKGSDHLSYIETAHSFCMLSKKGKMAQRIVHANLVKLSVYSANWSSKIPDNSRKGTWSEKNS